jgi:hypothetical protein
MLDIALSIIVVISVVMVGLLITIGHERQRKAIQGVHDSLRAWAMNDLKIKREREERNISVQHPIKWLEEKARVVLGFTPNMHDSIIFIDDPPAIEAETGLGHMLVFSPVEPKSMRQKCRNNRGNSGLLNEHSELLGRNPRKAEAYELTAMNAGIFFDIELAQVWTMLTETELGGESIWVYVVEK